MSDHDMEWADDHGYVRYRCPDCGRLFYTDGDPRGECCGAGRDEEEAAEGEDAESNA